MTVPPNIIYKLTFRFKHIILLYDMDATGIESAKKHEKLLCEYGETVASSFAGDKNGKGYFRFPGGQQPGKLYQTIYRLLGYNL